MPLFYFHESNNGNNDLHWKTLGQIKIFIISFIFSLNDSVKIDTSIESIDISVQISIQYQIFDIY